MCIFNSSARPRSAILKGANLQAVEIKTLQDIKQFDQWLYVIDVFTYFLT